MPGKRVAMRKTREVLRLYFDPKLGQQQIARSANVSQSMVHDYLERFTAAGLSWPLPAELSETELEAALFPADPRQDGQAGTTTFVARPTSSEGRPTTMLHQPTIEKLLAMRMEPMVETCRTFEQDENPQQLSFTGLGLTTHMLNISPNQDAWAVENSNESPTNRRCSIIALFVTFQEVRIVKN